MRDVNHRFTLYGLGGYGSNNDSGILKLRDGQEVGGGKDELTNSRKP